MSNQVGTAVLKIVSDGTSAEQGINRIGGLARTVLGVAAVAGVAKMGQAFVEEAQRVDRSWGQVRTLLTDMSTEDFARLQDAVEEWGVQTGQTAQEVATAAYDALSAGVQRTDLVEFLDEARRFALAGNASLVEAVGGLTSATNAFSDDSISAAQAARILFQAIASGKTTARELSSQLGVLSVGAQTAGVDIDEMAASLAFLTTKGVDTARATTSLNALWAEAAKVNSTLDKAIREQYGRGILDLADAGVRFNDVLVELYNTMGQERFASMFSSIEASRAAMLLVQDSGAGVKAVLDDMATSQERYNEAVRVMVEETEREARARAEYERARIEVGRELRPIATGIMGGAAHVLRVLTGRGEGHERELEFLNRGGQLGGQGGLPDALWFRALHGVGFEMDRLMGRAPTELDYAQMWRPHPGAPTGAPIVIQGDAYGISDLGTREREAEADQSYRGLPRSDYGGL